MQLKKSALVCAAAFAAMAAGSANAAMSNATDAAVVDTANAAGRVIFISGASAVQSGFGAIINTLFTGTPIRFANTTASSKDYEAAAGTLAAGTGDWAGQTAIVIYRVKGGSAFGVDPVARNTAIESLAVDSTNCSGTASPYTCSLDTAGRKPDAGVSDVAPKFFKNPYNTEGEVAAPSLTATELAVFSSANKGSQTAIYGLAFGVPTTNNVAGAKLTRSAVSAIMAGNVGTWDQVDSSLSGEIVVCRRVPGSGTQAVMNMWAGNFPCTSTSNVPADRDASPAWDAATKTFTAANGAGGLIVIENSTSGDVRSCLDAAQSGGSYATKDRNGAAVTVDFGGTSYGAIGVLSMDSLSSSKTTGKWAFRALDGVGAYYWDNTAGAVSTSGTGKLPTKEAYENGDWDLQGWVSFNIPGRTSGAAGTVGNGKRGVLNKFLNSAQNPTVLAGITALKNVAMAIPGGSYTGAQVLDAAYLNGDQCAPYSRNYND